MTERHVTALGLVAVAGAGAVLLLFLEGYRRAAVDQQMAARLARCSELCTEPAAAGSLWCERHQRPKPDGG